MIFRCQPGYELFLEREIRPLGFSMGDNGGGWLAADPAASHRAPDSSAHSGASDACAAPGDLCFAHATLVDPQIVSGESVNALAARIADIFLESARTERFEGAWPLAFECAAGLDGLGRRVDGVEKAFGEILRKRMSRVAKLAVPPARAGALACAGTNTNGPARETAAGSRGRMRGLFVFFTDFQKAFVARECVRGGQQRMADDPLAPSRSYLKVEEAYGVLGREPAAGELVVDLGAAPGGWSFSAAKRGARVFAVDNGPLKGGALGNPLITHVREDAFRFDPAMIPDDGSRAAAPADWLFCDLVEEPHHVLENIVAPWLRRGWCRRFVVNLKFGRVDALALLCEVRAADGPLAAHAPVLRVRHLYHDREEFTLVGECAARDVLRNA